MSHLDSNTKQGSSQLSAEAESFVPSKYVIADGLDTDHSRVSDSTGSQDYTLPHYVTNCYPFVTHHDASSSLQQQAPPAGRNQQRSHRGGGGSWGRGYRSNSSQQRPQSGGYPASGMRGPPPHHQLSFNRPPSASHFNKPPFGMAPPHLQQQGHLPPHLARHPSPSAPGVPPPIGMESMWAGPYNDYSTPYGYYGQNSGGYMQQHPGDLDAYPKEKNKVKSSKSGRKKSNSVSESNMRGHMISVGIQNEAAAPYQGFGGKKKNKPRTIICMDAGIQTDFSDDLANLTLAERPNALYQADKSKNKSRSWYHYQQETSTDSEEVDSDSGYSSPLHRRNQMSNGTHPAAHGLAQMSHPVGLMDPAILRGGPSYPLAGYQTNGYLYNHSGPILDNFTSSSSSFTPYHQGISTTPATLTYASITMSSTSSSALHGATPQSSASSNVKSNASVQKSNQSVNSQAATRGQSEQAEEEETNLSKKKRGKKRRKKRKGGVEDVGALSDEPFDLHRAHSSSNVSRTSTLDNDPALQFEDEKEFPNLLSACSGSLATSMSSQPISPMSYSDILKSQRSPRSQESSISGSTSGVRSNRHSLNSTPTFTDHKKTGKESKSARKRRKRREQANAAADEELAEITLEQQVLKELSTKSGSAVKTKDTQATAADDAQKDVSKPQAQPAGKKSKQPISLNIADMISALEKHNAHQKAMENKTAEVSIKHDKDVRAANPLDSSAPVKRGKERETPKVKKPSPLKKVILKEREEKKRLRLLNETTGAPLSPSPASTDSPMQIHDSAVTAPPLPLDSDLSQEAVSSKASPSLDYCIGGTPASADMSPISQTSPISMSPLSGSPLNSGVNSPVAGNLILGESAADGDRESNVLSKIHSRRFREYCNQVLDKDIDACCTALLQDLVRFQDRLFNKDPIKAKSKRRIVLGLREVTKHLKLKKIKCVVISPNLERIQSKGGLDDALNTIISLCSEQNVPFVFALGRRALGRACAKLVPVSVVGVFNYEGSESNFQKLMDLQRQAREQYEQMVEIVENEIEKPASSSANGSSDSAANGSKAGAGNNGSVAGFQQLFAHMGHSRTPSACSAISFTSSILSEPISENYPHSEPETDSRGYEIVQEEKSGGVRGSEVPLGGVTETGEDARCESPNSTSASQEKMIIVEALDEIDEGHEADTEEDHQSAARKALISESSSGMGDKTPPSRRRCSELSVTSGCKSRSNSDCVEDTVEVLPHIESIHSSALDLSAEILSQHSSKTYDASTAEVLSTHSSRTLEGGVITPDRSSRNMGSLTDLQEACNTLTSLHEEATETENFVATQKVRSLDKERIESWVAETQKQIEVLTITEGDNEDSKNSTCDSNQELSDSSDTNDT